MSIVYAADSDTGHVRDHNEDAWLARPDLGLWVVADGMGGHSAGEVASALAVRAIEAAIIRGVDLAQAVVAGHEAILEAAASGEGAPGMGSTVVALLVQGHRYQIAWVGDSRAYLWDGQELRQLTRDHSYVQRLVDSGLITPEQAIHHPERNTIAQALGVAGGGLSVDVVDGVFAREDQLLLCSDGLTGEVRDSEIALLLANGGAQAGEPRKQVDALVGAALDHGGSDNVTVVLVSAPLDAAQRVPRAKTVPIDSARLNQLLLRRERARRWAPIAGVALGAVLILGSLVWWVADTGREPSKSVGGGASLQREAADAAAVNDTESSSAVSDWRDREDILSGRPAQSAADSAEPVTPPAASDIEDAFDAEEAYREEESAQEEATVGDLESIGDAAEPSAWDDDVGEQGAPLRAREYGQYGEQGEYDETGIPE